MSLETDAVRVLVCRLLAHQTLPRTDELVRRLFVDATYREGVESALAQVGLELAENVYAPYITVRVARELETPVFEDGRGSYWSNNVGLSGGAMALLTILWSLLILPKRQRQQEAQGDTDDNGHPPPVRTADLDIAVERKTLEADFGHLFGSQIRFHGYLSELKRRGFIQERRGKLTEGPLLDVVVDYSTLAPRIIEGALSRVLAARFDQPFSVSAADASAAEDEETS
ncbi:MAG TPA: hypothetical protein VLK82_09695 [Candidatus Tectomicrobia bacterium]|nr:hypothetical protein [Candidatus Tectomicrobia bacterium]